MIQMIKLGQIIIADNERYEVCEIWPAGASKVIDFTAKMLKQCGTDINGNPVYYGRGFSNEGNNWVYEEKEVTKHMKEHLIGKVVSDVEHIETDSMYGLTQSGMKISFVDGTSLTVNIEIDEELSDHPNLDWKVDLPQAIEPTEPLNEVKAVSYLKG